MTAQNDNTVISCPQVVAKGDPSRSLARPVLIRDKVQGLARAHRHLIAFIFLLLLSLPLRLMNLGEPFTGEHEFRQKLTDTGQLLS